MKQPNIGKETIASLRTSVRSSAATPAGEAFVFGDFAEDGSSRSSQAAEKSYADAAWRRQMYGPKQNSDAMAMPRQQLHSSGLVQPGTSPSADVGVSVGTNPGPRIGGTAAAYWLRTPTLLPQVSAVPHIQQLAGCDLSVNRTLTTLPFVVACHSSFYLPQTY
jgi:hypothetical protein